MEMRNKKLVAFITAIVMLATVMPIGALAAGSATLTVEASQSVVTVGETITVNVQLSGDAQAYGLQAKLLYDAEKVEYVAGSAKVTLIQDGSNATINDGTAGEISVNTISTSGAVQNGSILEAQFTVRDAATGTIQFKLDDSFTELTAGLAEGFAEIPTNGISADVKIAVPATNITIDQGSTPTVERGQTTQLTATLTPPDSTDTVEWSSDKEDIATVDKNTGVVTGVKAGEATITAKVKDNDNLSATCTVTVTNPAISGELSISGNAVFGATLTASLSGYESGVTYTWYRNDGGSETEIGNNATYTIVADDIGKTLTVKATHPDFEGTVEKSAGRVEKASQDAPNPPTAASTDYTSITLTAVPVNIDWMPTANGRIRLSSVV